MRRISLLGVAATAAALVPAMTSAQLAPVPAANGVAGAYVSQARGQEALWINPAGLAASGGPKVTLGLFNFGTSFSALGLDLQQVQGFAQGDNFDASARTSILSKIPTEGTQIRGQFLLPLASLQVGRLAFGIGAGAVYDYNVGRDFVDMALNGYTQNRVDYRIGNTNGRQATYIDAAVAFGQKIGPIALGVTGHYIMPRAIDNWRFYEPEFDIVNRTMRMQAYTVGTNAGSGFSVDVGGTVNLGLVTVSAVLQNAAGNVTWNEDNVAYRGFVLTNQNVEDAGQVLTDAFSENATPLTATSPLGAIQAAQGLYNQAFLPRTLRVGGHAKLPILGTRISAQYNNQLQAGFLGGFWAQSVSVGAAQKILFFTPSVGFAQSTDPAEGSLLTAGLGLGPLNLAVAQLKDGTRFNANREGVMVSFGLTLGF
jgi:hypothetical protein